MTGPVSTGRARYVLVDYPIAQLHPDTFKSTKRPAARVSRASPGRSTRTCRQRAGQGRPAADRAGEDNRARRREVQRLPRRGRHAVAIRDSVEPMRGLGSGTPLTLIGVAPRRRADGGLQLGVRREAVSGFQSRHRRGARRRALSPCVDAGRGLYTPPGRAVKPALGPTQPCCHYSSRFNSPPRPLRRRPRPLPSRWKGQAGR